MFPINRRIVVAKTESTPGTAEFDLVSTFPADGDFDNRIFNAEFSTDVPMDEEVMNVLTGDYGELPAYSTLQQGEISFEIPCDWGGAVAVEPKWVKFIEACGFLSSAYTTTGIGFQPLSAYACQTLTIAIIDSECGISSPKSIGYLFKGCAGNVELVASGVGAKWSLKFSFKGAFVDAYDVDYATEIPALTGASTLIAEKLLSNAVTVHGVTQLLQNFSLNFGGEVNMVPDQSDATGIKQFYVSARKPRLAMNVTMNHITDEDVWNSVFNETTGIITIASTNLTIYCPRTQYFTPSVTDLEGIVGYEHNFGLLRNSNGNAPILATIPDECAVELLQGARA